MRQIFLPASLAIIACVAPGPTIASSPDAWEDFRKDVRAKCLAAAGKELFHPQIQVDPFGSKSYGVALISALPKGGAKRVLLICVYNKQTKAVELGGEMAR